jgi:hypothetical protein
METDVVLGDARLTLARAQPGTYDLLVIDAFNSDAQRLRGGGDHGLLPAESERSAATSVWIVLAREPDDFGPPRKDPRWAEPARAPGVPAWTDDYAGITRVLIWR